MPRKKGDPFSQGLKRSEIPDEIVQRTKSMLAELERAYGPDDEANHPRCWPAEPVQKNGYGCPFVHPELDNGLPVHPHRLVYVIAYERDILPGDVVSHECGKTACLKPSHLHGAASQLHNHLLRDLRAPTQEDKDRAAALSRRRKQAIVDDAEAGADVRQMGRKHRLPQKIIRAFLYSLRRVVRSSNGVDSEAA